MKTIHYKLYGFEYTNSKNYTDIQQPGLSMSNTISSSKMREESERQMRMRVSETLNAPTE